MLLTASIVYLLATFFVFVEAKPVRQGSIDPTYASSARNTDMSASSITSEAKVLRHAKRQGNLTALQTAVVLYDCPVSGIQVRVFKYAAIFTGQSRTIVMHSREHIDSWDHVDVITNNFSTYFNHEYCAMRTLNTHRFCCVYTFKAQLIGSVLHDHIELDFTTVEDNPSEAPKVTELCMTIQGDLTCPQQQCPVRDVWQSACTVRQVVVIDA